MYPTQPPHRPPYQPPPQVVYVQQRSGSGWFTAAGVWVLVLVIAGPVLAVLLCCGAAVVSIDSNDPDTSPTATSDR